MTTALATDSAAVSATNSATDSAAVLATDSAPDRAAAPRARPRLTVRPAPRREPPFDDETAARHLRLVGPLDRPLPFDQPRPLPLPLPAPRTDAPDPRLWGRRLLQGIIESAAGRRPMQQLIGMLGQAVARGVRHDIELREPGTGRHWTHAAVVRSVHVSEPTDGVAEICATLQVGPRCRAIALRAELQHGAWRCTRLQLG